MKAKEIGIWTAVIFALIGGLWLMVSAINNSPSPSTPLAIKIPEISAQDFVKGNANAKVTLVEYSDFQCPACAAVYPLVKRLEEDFKTDLRVVYRFFPLTNIHPNTLISSQAAYAAGLQNKFWEMHDMLFENQSDWSPIDPRKTFIDYAQKLGLDLNKFKADLESESTKKFVADAGNNALSLGINSTPTFFINGTHISNPLDYDAFKQIIQNEINKK